MQIHPLWMEYESNNVQKSIRYGWSMKMVMQEMHLLQMEYEDNHAEHPSVTDAILR